MARAIRAALALTTVALAMSGSGSVFAAPGVCTPAGPPAGSTVDCDGVFDAGNGNVPIVYAVEDLTLILGATDPATTVDSNGAAGVTMTGTTGGETLLNYADISVVDAYGVVVSTTSGDISITTGGDISAYTAGYPNSVAIHADSYYGAVDVAVLAGADVVVYNSSGSGTGVYAYSQTGAVDVDSAGTIYVSTSGTAYGIYAASDDGVVTVTNTGSVTANSGSDAYGIYAQSYANVYVDNQGTVIATSTGYGSNATGVFVYTCDCTALDANVDNSGSITATTTGNNGDAYGIYIYAYDYGNANVDNSGSIDVNAYGVGANATGVYVTLTDGVATIDSAGSITVYGYNDAYGVNVQLDGDGSASVTNGGAIDVTAYSGYGTGVYVAGNGNGDIYVGSSGSIDVTAYQYAVGIHAYSNYAGAVTVDNSGGITVVSTSGPATGIMTSSADSDTTVDNSGSITVTTYAAYGSIIGINAYGYNDATVYNSGDITVDAQGAGAYANGIMVIAYAGAITVDSSGSISATATGAAHGIDISGNDGDVTVTTAGTIDATSSNAGAYGMQIGVYGYGNVSIDNGADITVDTAYGIATGIDVHAYYGDIVVTSSGDITATSVGGDTHGIYVDNSQYGDITVTNDGAITLYGGGDSYGIYAQTYGNVAVTSNGSIDVTATGNYNNAYGILVYTCDCDAGSVTVDNTGDISATADGLNGNAYGIHVYAYGYGSATISNDGNIVASANSATGSAAGIYATLTDSPLAIDSAGTVTVYAGADAYGIHAVVHGAGSVTVTSGGSIDVTSGNDNGYGILATTNGVGNVSVDSSSAIGVQAYYNATGIDAYASGTGAVDVNNDGSITVVSDSAYATGIHAQAYGDITVTGSGDISATSYGDYVQATGIYAINYYSGNIDVTLGGGSIDVYAPGAQAAASGIVAITAYGDVSVASAADIQVAGYYTTGISAVSNYFYGDASVDNSGNITLDGSYNALGISADGNNVVVDNSGSVVAAAGTGTGWGIIATGGNSASVYNSGTVVGSGDAYGVGITAHATGTVYVGNSGSVTAIAYAGYAYGIIASPFGGGTTVVVDNSGSVSADGYLGAWGIIAYAYGYDVSVTGGGSVDANSAVGSAYGIQAFTYDADVLVDAGSTTASAYLDAVGIDAHVTGDGNVTVYSGTLDVYSATGNAVGLSMSVSGDGDLYAALGGPTTVSGHLDATGAQVIAYGYGAATVLNSGAMSVTSDYALAQGIFVQAQGGGNAYAGNSGAIDVSGQHGLGTGIYAGSDLGYASVDNSGSVAVAVYYSALGIGVLGFYGATVYNDGSVSVVSDYYDATGVNARSQYGDVRVDNAGAISVQADDQAYGIDAYTYGAGAIAIANGGDVAVASYSDAAIGISAIANGGGPVTVDSTGDIDVSGYSSATGIYAQTSGILDVSLAGNVGANASGAYYTAATGADLLGYDVNFSAAGAVVADASADAGAGAAYATGVRIEGTYVGVYTDASSSISAAADGFYATAVGLDVNGSYGLYLGLDGGIQAVATGAYAWATGVQASSYVDILVYSSADISAVATGSGYASATGVSISSLAGDIFFYNGGDISATGADFAVAVQLYGSGSTVFINQGTVSAYADAFGGIAFLSGDADDSIYNNGTITGAIATGDGDDTLLIASGATWNAFGDSDFGNGDDTITNYGTINMSDAVIDLGLPGTFGNGFANYGTITVSGAYNVIDMEGGSAALAMSAALSAGPASVPSSNPQAFYNYGLIDFRDGAPDDVLTIVGDFGGDGAIAVDVSGLNGSADLLYIDGSVVSGSVNSIDIDLLDLPADGLAEIPVVEVSGNSVSGSFVLGSVDFTPNPFLTTNISLVSNINSANTSPDMFSLRVSLSASDAGAIAAVLPAGVQLLMNDVVGSWHKRGGGLDDPDGGKFSLWARIYQNKGKVDPEFRSDGVQGGSFAFEQKNTGGEAGFDFAPNGRWNFGLILGKANANQDLRVGLGTDRIEGTVAGGYGTYRLPRGFYFDLSHRRMKFDASIDTPQGEMLASGEAQTSNAESGYSFNYKGFEIEGQLQVTHTKLVSLDALTLAPLSSASALAAAAASDPVVFDNDADLSTVSRLGVDLRKKFKTKPGTLWELHATLNRVRQSGGRNQFHVTDTLGGETDIGGDSSLLDVGFTARRGFLLYYGALTWQDGGALQNFFGAQLGAKYTW